VTNSAGKSIFESQGITVAENGFDDGEQPFESASVPSPDLLTPNRAGAR